jgi:hypothetical protein
MGAQCKTFIGIYLRLRVWSQLLNKITCSSSYWCKMMKTKFCPITGVEGIVKVQNLEKICETTVC